jgi:hypothetical protein
MQSSRASGDQSAQKIERSKIAIATRHCGSRPFVRNAETQRLAQGRLASLHFSHCQSTLSSRPKHESLLSCEAERSAFVSLSVIPVGNLLPCRIDRAPYLRHAGGPERRLGDEGPLYLRAESVRRGRHLADLLTRLNCSLAKFGNFCQPRAWVFFRIWREIDVLLPVS